MKAAPHSENQPAGPRTEISWCSLAVILALPLFVWALLLLFPASHRTPPADQRGMQLEEAGKWMTSCLLVLLGMMIAVTAWVVLALRRRARRPDPALELLDEVYLAARRGDAPAPENGGAPPADPPAWEKPGDWWRRPDSR